MTSYRCFYCGEETHVVNDCVNPEFLRLYEAMKNIHVRTRTTNNNRVNQNNFMDEIMNFYYDDIISVAIKYAYAMYPDSVIATPEYYKLELWSHFEQQYLRNRRIIINNFVSVANIYFIDAPHLNNVPTNTTDVTITSVIDNSARSIIQQQRQRQRQREREREQRQRQRQREKHDFIVTIETEKYTLEQEEECPICLDNVKCFKFVEFNCKHKFCVKCVIKSIKTKPKDIHSCALCRCETETVRVYSADTYDLVRQL